MGRRVGSAKGQCDLAPAAACGAQERRVSARFNDATPAMSGERAATYWALSDLSVAISAETSVRSQTWGRSSGDMEFRGSSGDTILNSSRMLFRRGRLAPSRCARHLASGEGLSSVRRRSKNSLSPSSFGQALAIPRESFRISPMPDRRRLCLS